MDSQKRLMLAMVLSALVIFASQYFFAKPLPPSPADGGVALATAPVVEANSGALAPLPAPQVNPAASGSPAPVLTEVKVSVSRAQVHYVFSNLGGGLLSAELQGPKMREQEEVSWNDAMGRLLGKKAENAPQMNMAHPVTGQPLPLSLSITGAQPFNALTHFAVEDDGANRRVTFRGSDNGWEVTKVFHWDNDGFELAYDVTVKNLSDQPRQGELALHTLRGIDADHEESPSMFGGVGNQAQVGCAYADDYKHTLPMNKPPEEFKGPISFFGIDQQYFLTAVFPRGGARDGRCVLAATPTERTATAYFPLQVAAGQSVTQAFGVFMGPKDTDALSAAPSGTLAPAGAEPGNGPHLERAIDYGWWGVICKILMGVLKFCHRLGGNWGLAIIMLTLLVRLLMTPINHRMMVGQVKMQKVNPKLEAIKKKYPDDRERQQMEQMKLYKEEGINPFGSCLLLVLQMPIWIALFRTLRNSYEIYREPFFGAVWTDLTYKDPTYILPLLLGISQVITTRLQPQTMAPEQAKLMNWLMPVMFTAFLLKYPLGLTLYIFASNVVGVIQQYTSKRLIARASEAQA